MTTKALNQDNLYQTSDLALATVISLWYPIETIDRLSPQKAQFVFKSSNELDGLVEKYWRKEVKIEPQAFFQQLRILKARLYEN